MLQFISAIKTDELSLSKSAAYILVNQFRESYTVKQLCKTFNVSTSGYYDWRKRNGSADPDATIRTCIIKFQKSSDFTIGYRRMTSYVSQDLGITINHKKIYRIMKKYDLLSKVSNTKKQKIYRKAINGFPNIINNDYNATKPNEIWCTDLTTIKTNEGKLHISAIIDLYDRYIVSLCINSKQNTALVKKTIKEAFIMQNIDSSTNILLPSDQGIQYTTESFSKFATINNIKQSMSRKAKPTDNAVIESFFATLKKERLNRYTFKTKADAIAAIESYIYFYNYFRKRLRTKLTPYETRCRYFENTSPILTDTIQR